LCLRLAGEPAKLEFPWPIIFFIPNLFVCHNLIFGNALSAIMFVFLIEGFAKIFFIKS